MSKGGGAERLQNAVLAAQKQLGLDQNSIPCKEVLRHIQSILTFLIDVEQSSSGFKGLKATLLDIRESVVELLWKGGWYKHALDTARETFYTRKDILGSQPDENMKSLNLYIKALLYQGRYREAEPLIQQSFQKIDAYRLWYPKSKSEYAIEFLSCIQSYTVMLRYKGEFEEALEKSEQAWAEGKKKLRSQDRHTLRSLSNLALAYLSCGYYAKAVEHSGQALEALESQQNIPGEDDPDTLDTRDCFAYSLCHLGLYEEAAQEIERAVTERSIALGEKHPETLSSLQNYAAIHRAQGNYRSAAEKTERALLGRREMLGEDHPDTLASRHHLSLIYICQGKYQEAKKEAQISFARGDKIYSP